MLPFSIQPKAKHGTAYFGHRSLTPKPVICNQHITRGIEGRGEGGGGGEMAFAPDLRWMEGERGRGEMGNDRYGKKGMRNRGKGE